VFLAFIFYSRRRKEVFTNPIFRYGIMCCVTGLMAASRLFAKGSASDMVYAANLVVAILAFAREIWLKDPAKLQQ
jgi:hypothetical protein